MSFLTHSVIVIYISNIFHFIKKIKYKLFTSNVIIKCTVREINS